MSRKQRRLRFCADTTHRLERHFVDAVCETLFAVPLMFLAIDTAVKTAIDAAIGAAIGMSGSFSVDHFVVNGQVTIGGIEDEKLVRTMPTRF